MIARLHFICDLVFYFSYILLREMQTMENEFDSAFSEEDMKQLIADLPNILRELENWVKNQNDINIPVAEK